jgi:dGTPase
VARSTPEEPNIRSSFERDSDRIIFSAAFRRLADRTQVVPSPKDDHVHSRLTHSLEVSTIGRSLATQVGERLRREGLLPDSVTPQELGDCVAAASLVHDLGNPPFGHAGEHAIREFFASHERSSWAKELTPRQWLDFARFEGNAQSLRLVTRVARPKGRAGLNLCAATLGALVKYPCASTATDSKSGKASLKKHGVNEAEDERFESIAASLGLAKQRGARAWLRHPLAFLTEAADDIGYAVVDLEDALRLGLIVRDEFVDALRPFAPDAGSAGRRLPVDREEIFEMAGGLRTSAIATLIGRALQVFVKHHDAILSGEFDAPLMDAMRGSAAFHRLKKLARERYYQARDVLRMEIAGAAAIKGVLEALVTAAFAGSDVRSKNLRRLVPCLEAGGSTYERLLAVTDHVSGMTDGYVLRQFREIVGTRLPGGRD